MYNSPYNGCTAQSGPKSALPQERQPTRYQRRSASRAFVHALNAVPAHHEEPPLQTLPRDLLRAHVFEAVSLWDLGRLGCAASWLAETVFDDQKAWERRNGLLVGGLQCMHGGVLGATRAGRVAERCWTAILTRPRRRRGPLQGDALLRGVLGRRQRRGAAARRGRGGGRAHGAPCALPPQGGRARAASIDAEASLGWISRGRLRAGRFSDAVGLTQLIAEAGASPASGGARRQRYLLHAAGRERRRDVPARRRRPPAGPRHGRRRARARRPGRGPADCAPRGGRRGQRLRLPLRGLGPRGPAALPPARRRPRSESSPRCVASGALFFLERDTFVPARHVMQAANTGFLEQIHHQNQLKVAAAAAGRFVGFLEDGGRTLPAGVRKPVFRVRVTTRFSLLRRRRRGRGARPARIAKAPSNRVCALCPGARRRTRAARSVPSSSRAVTASRRSSVAPASLWQ